MDDNRFFGRALERGGWVRPLGVGVATGWIAGASSVALASVRIPVVGPSQTPD
jgi:hypothetical protein